MSESSRMIKFTKMQGAGNDYIYIDCLESMVSDPENLAIKMSDRHFGVGSDGLVLIAPSAKADCRMIMYNLDGSEGNMCGNAIRCVAKFMHDEKGCINNPMTIETKSGIKTLWLTVEDGRAVSVRVDMGSAILDPVKIPVELEGNDVIDRAVEVDGEEYNITCVSMGNPHAVIFTDIPVELLDLPVIGPKFEFNKIFPERVNTEFVNVIDDHTLRMRVWERGSGETMACGTGACATAVAACLNSFCHKDEDIKVILNGGELTIRYTDETVFMTGPAAKVFEGTMEV